MIILAGLASLPHGNGAARRSDFCASAAYVKPHCVAQGGMVLSDRVQHELAIVGISNAQKTGNG